MGADDLSSTRSGAYHSAHMEEEAIPVDAALGMALDFDVLRDGFWAGVFQRADGFFVSSADGSEFPVDGPLAYPMIRLLGDRRVVVVSSRSRGSAHSFIANIDGSEKRVFSAGDGVEDVVVLRDLFAVTYFDEGVFSGVPPSQEGIAFFDMSGDFFGGYRSIFGSDAADMVDCYAACRADHHTIAFTSYVDFPLVYAQPQGPSHRSIALPRTLHGAAALTVRGRQAFFFSPYDHPQSVLRWDSSASEPPVQIGSFAGRLRGLEYGRFLSAAEHGFTVLTCEVG